MRCPYCGAATFVKETRGLASRPTRRRECFNEHRFTTEERLVRVDGMLTRDARMHEMWAKGKTMQEVAAAFGLKGHGQVSRALARMGVVNTRARGQQKRWAVK